jgi:hypothetical protein
MEDPVLANIRSEAKTKKIETKNLLLFLAASYLQCRNISGSSSIPSFLVLRDKTKKDEKIVFVSHFFVLRSSGCTVYES